MCEQLGIKVGTSEKGGSNMLKRFKFNNSMQQQKEEAENKAIEEHHAILFMLRANKYKCENVLRKEDTFHITVEEACHVLSKWLNQCSWKYNKNNTESNHGIAFATVT